MHLVRTIIPLLLWALVCHCYVDAAEKTKFSEHPFFKHLIGSWKSKGELKGADGNVIKISEEWTCKISDEGELIIDGTRDVNEGALQQKYRWSITHNPSTDLYEAVQADAENQQNALRFEGTLIGNPVVLELKAQFGNGGGSVTVTDSFTGEDRDTFETKIVAVKDNGDPNLEGTIKNERVK